MFDTTWFDNFFPQLTSLAQIAVTFLLGAALLLFIWGVIRYFMWASAEPAEREVARKYMIYALVGMVAIVAIWGIVNLLLIILGVGTDPAPLRPVLPKAA